MQIEGIGNKVLLNDEHIETSFPFTITYDGELIYEVVRIKDGTPLFWKEHLERMAASLDLIDQNGQGIVSKIDGHIRRYIRQGVYENNNIKIIIGNFKSGVFDYMAYYVPSYYPDQAFYERGAKVLTLTHERKNPNAKMVNQSLTEKVTKLRQETGAYEVALVNTEGIITEGSRSNLFFLCGGCIHVSEGQKILKGITMLKVIQLFKRLGLSYEESDVRKTALGKYEACFMTSTSNNVLPIDSIDEHRFDSSHHPLIQQLMTAFDDLIQEDQTYYKQSYEGGNNNE